MPNLLTTAEVADALGYSVATVTRKARLGEIPAATKLPGVRGAYLFERSVIELIKSQTVGRSA